MLRSWMRKIRALVPPPWRQTILGRDAEGVEDEVADGLGMVSAHSGGTLGELREECTKAEISEGSSLE